MFLTKKIEERVDKLEVDLVKVLENLNFRLKKLEGRESASYATLKVDKPIKLIAHDGGQPPHTLEGIRNSIKEGVYGIEVDVCWTEDKRAVIADTPKDIKEDSPEIEQVFELCGDKLQMIIIDRPQLSLNMTHELSFKLLQEKAIKCGVQDKVVFQFSSWETMRMIDMKKFKVSLSRFDMPKEAIDAKVPFFTLNPFKLKGGASEISKKQVELVREAGIEPIVCGMKYQDEATEKLFYDFAIITGAELIMLDYPRAFKEWAAKYNIEVWQPKGR